MRAAILIWLLAVATTTMSQNQAPSPPKGDWEHTLWIDGTLTAISRLKLGMSRKELDKLFALEGGFHGGEDWVYTYKECPYIKVDVQFTSEGKISRISRPYLEHPTNASD